MKCENFSLKGNIYSMMTSLYISFIKKFKCERSSDHCHTQRNKLVETNNAISKDNQFNTKVKLKNVIVCFYLSLLVNVLFDSYILYKTLFELTNYKIYN